MNSPKTNIYDVDGEIIRKCGDNHEFTFEECQEKIKYYTEKLKTLDKSDPDFILKASTYNQYIDNLVAYCLRKKLFETKYTNEAVDTIPDETSIPTVQIVEPMNDDRIDIVDLEPIEETTESVGDVK